MREKTTTNLIELNHKGIKMLLRPYSTDEKVFNEVVVKHNYEKKSFKIEPEETWLDLGANIGTFTRYAISKGAHVIAYEPEISNFNLLVKNLEGFEENSKCFQKAVIAGDNKEMGLSLGKDETNHWRHSLYKNKKGGVVKVECININKVITSKITGIKMDIEGGEIEIFDKLEDWKNVTKLVFEYHFDIQPNMFKFFQQMKKLKKHFTVVDYGSMPTGIVEYKFFPPARTIFCSK